MTIYDAIKAKLNAGQKKVKVTSITEGKKFAVISKQDVHSFPIYVPGVGTFTATGKAFHSDKYPSLALGHFNSQLECAQAIKEQNFYTGLVWSKECQSTTQ